MASRFQRLRTLPPRERWQLVALGIAQPMVSLALRLFGYKSTLTWLERHSDHPAPHAANPVQLADAERLAQLAAIAGRHSPVEVTCLRQALAVFWLLRKRGLQPKVKLGVGRSRDAAPDMHAWVELDGQTLAQPDLRHTPFEEAAARQSETTSTTSGKRA